MKLTRRQLEFLQQTNTLQHQNDGDPIHYTDLAEQLGVSGITAYNMLKTLEHKSCVMAKYQLPEKRVGRSSIVFELTPNGYLTLKSST